MKKSLIPFVVILGLTSCSSRSYFTVGIRKQVENNSISVEKLQYFVDRTVELRRVLASGDPKVASGKVKLENGRYVNIILLKKNTPGICLKFEDSHVEIAFEKGSGK